MRENFARKKVNEMCARELQAKFKQSNKKNLVKKIYEFRACWNFARIRSIKI